MITTLGQHISLIRPSTPYKCKIYNNELPRASRQSRTKTIKAHCGHPTTVAIKTKYGRIHELSNTSLTHLDVAKRFNVLLSIIIEVGWRLDNGNYVWRPEKIKE